MGGGGVLRVEVGVVCFGGSGLERQAVGSEDAEWPRSSSELAFWF